MKTKITLTAAALLLGVAGTSFAGNRPALTYPAGILASSSEAAQMDEVTPWHKGALHHMAAASVGPGVWYTHCPVMTGVVLNSKHEAEVTLSNGKKIMLSCAGLKDTVEADLEKYEPYMY
jgi:hypothetical protein